jgi:hypothetical protein
MFSKKKEEEKIEVGFASQLPVIGRQVRLDISTLGI